MCWRFAFQTGRVSLSGGVHSSALLRRNSQNLSPGPFSSKTPGGQSVSALGGSTHLHVSAARGLKKWGSSKLGLRVARFKKKHKELVLTEDTHVHIGVLLGKIDGFPW